MAYHIDLLSDYGVAHVILAGEIDGDTIVGAYRAMRSDARWREGYDQLWDCREADTLVLSPEDMDELQAVSDALCSGLGRTAIVANHSLTYSIGMLVSALVSRKHHGKEMSVFRSIADAVQWLEKPTLLARLQAAETKGEL